MTRRSKLSDEQWAEFGKRLLEGGAMRTLAKEYGVAEASAREHFKRRGQTTETVQKVAAKLFEAQVALRQLPTEAQVQAMTLAQRLHSISESLAIAADHSAKTAVRLSALANTEVQKVDDAEPLKGKSAGRVKNVLELTSAAKEAFSLPVALLNANRDAVRRLSDEPPPNPDGILTPERMTEGARKLAFVLHRAAALENT